MKVLSLLQPWASLVVMGHKKIETRSWNTKYRGELLIHASAGKKGDVKKMCEQEPFKSAIADFDGLPNGKYDFLPFGAIIGKVNLIDTFNSEFLNALDLLRVAKVFNRNKEYQFQMTDQELAFGDYSPGRYGWLLSDPVQFEIPIPCKGSLSIWKLPQQYEQLLPKNLDNKTA